MGPIEIFALCIVGLAAIVISATLLRRKPQFSFSLWLFIACFVPYWLSIPMSPFVPLLVLATGVLSVSAFRTTGLRLSVADKLVLVLGAAVTVAAGSGIAQFSDALVVVGQWVIPYFLGRAFLASVGMYRIADIVAIFAAIVAVFAIVELAADWHPFVGMSANNTAYQSWGWIQYRAGIPRSEWVFGHSIALGNILVIALPFAIFSSFRSWCKALIVVLILAAVATTLSRNALIAAAISLALSLILLKGDRISTGLRLLLVGSMVVATLGLAPWILGSLDSAGEEVSTSSSYRLLMFSLLPTIKLLGASGTYIELYDGNMGYLSEAYKGGAARSVDNTLVLLGLNLGWIPVLLTVALLLTLLLRLPRARNNPALIAIVGQFPTLMTVAMITQYSSVFWLVVGVASAAVSMQRQAQNDSNGTESERFQLTTESLSKDNR